MIIEFYYSEDSFLMEIDADLKTIENELDAYREADEQYNADDWLKWLRQKGIKAKIIEPDEEIYF